MGITQSMGSVGDSYDNAMAESLWSSLKRELFDGHVYATKLEARTLVFEWIMWIIQIVFTVHSATNRRLSSKSQQFNKLQRNHVSGLRGEPQPYSRLTLGPTTRVVHCFHEEQNFGFPTEPPAAHLNR